MKTARCLFPFRLPIRINSSLLALVLVPLFLFGLSAQADTVTGNILNVGADSPLFLVVKDPAHSDQTKSYAIQTLPSLLTYLRRMKTGDELTAQGSVSLDQKDFILDSIDRIGLQELLGAWKSSRWEIFEFLDYNQLNLYIPTVAEAGEVSLSRTHSLKYVVTPEQDDRFSIFISDNNDVRMGFIAVGKNKLTLSITDFKTGQTTENISLSPLLTQ